MVRIGAEGSRREERNSDGELGCEKEGKIEEACPGDYHKFVSYEIQQHLETKILTASVATGERLKPILEDIVICICANVGSDQDPVPVEAVPIVTNMG